jgi:hypothetical protein
VFRVPALFEDEGTALRVLLAALLAIVLLETMFLLNYIPPPP